MKALTLPVIAGVAVPFLALLLLVIGARGPYTHSNLTPWFGFDYNRTPLGAVGQIAPFRGSAVDRSEAQSPNLVVRGEALFVGQGCASCHGIRGQGGAVGPTIAGTEAATLREKTQKGPSGMPSFSPKDLTDEDIAAIAAYLQSVTSQEQPPSK